MIVDNDSIIELQKFFPSAVVAMAYREKMKIDSGRFIVGSAAGTDKGAVFCGVADILDLFFRCEPAPPLNRLLRPADLGVCAVGGAVVAAAPARYADFIVNLHTASDGCQHILIALDVGGDWQDAGHTASIEQNFMRVTTQIFGKLMGAQAIMVPQPAQPLTSREQDILVWLREGKSNWVIGQIVGISEHTVKHLVSSILKKYGVLSRYHLPHFQGKTASTTW